MREIDVEEEMIDLMGGDEYIDEDELVENDELDAFLVAFNKGERLA